MTAPLQPYKIKFTGDAKADIQSLDGSIKKRLPNILIEKIGFGRQQYGTPLRGNLAGYWKHEFAAHRVIYRIYPDNKLVVVCAVGARKGVHQSDVYRQLEVVAKTGRLAGQILAVLKALRSG